MTPEFTVYVEATPQIRELLENLTETYDVAAYADKFMLDVSTLGDTENTTIEVPTDIEYTVSTRWPRKKIDGNLITVTEITNIQTYVSVVDQIAWQIDIWSPDADIVRRLIPMVNKALCGLGLKRDFSGSMDYERTADGGYFRQTFRFGRNVDKRTMRLID